MNLELLQNIIGLIIGIIYTIIIPNNSPINNIPIELVFIYLTNPFNNNNNNKNKNNNKNNKNNNILDNKIINFVYKVILNVAFYLHTIRFILRFKESLLYTLNYKIISLLCIIIIIINKNNILPINILSIINGIMLFISYKNNSNNKLINWKIDIPITLSLLFYYIYQKKIKLSKDNYRLIMFNSDLLYHILEIIDWIINR